MKKPTVFLIHGYGVADDGAGTTDKARPFFEAAGYTVIEVDYGETNVFNVRKRNEEVVARILPLIEPGDILLGHSNGCLICWMLVEAGAKVAAVLCVQPALRKSTRWREDVRVLCTFNKGDWVVRFFGRAWGRFVSAAKPWADRHGWGAAGYWGFNPASNIVNIDIGAGEYPALGHSTVWRGSPGVTAYWMNRFIAWSNAVVLGM